MSITRPLHKLISAALCGCCAGEPCTPQRAVQCVHRFCCESDAALRGVQVAAVEWLWGLWVQRKGCLLADDMGLGKTLTCASLLAGLLKGKSIRRAIVVAPKTLLAQWKLELTRVGLKWQTHEYFGTPRQRETALTSVQQRRGVLLTTYGMITNQHQELCRCALWPAATLSLRESTCTAGADALVLIG